MEFGPVPLSAYLTLALILFSIGAFGVFVRRNALVVLLSVEIMLNAVNLTLVAYSREFGAVDGQIFVFFVMTVAAAEAAVGLAIILAIFRRRRTTDVDDASLMRW